VTNNNAPSLGEQLRTVRQETREVRGEVSDIGVELRKLLALELELAQAETNESVKVMTRAIGFGAGAAFIGLIGLTFLFLTIMFALDTALELWLAALITTGLIALIAAILFLLARQHVRRFSPLPRRFIRTMKEDMEWAKTQLNSIGR
jgi:hypothetical protein